jgi:hypothetical protein
VGGDEGDASSAESGGSEGTSSAMGGDEGDASTAESGGSEGTSSAVADDKLSSVSSTSSLSLEASASHPPDLRVALLHPNT